MQIAPDPPALSLSGSYSAGVPVILLAHIFLWFSQHTDDVVWHILWSEQFLPELSSGALYARWLSGMNDGLGRPPFLLSAALLPHQPARFIERRAQGAGSAGDGRACSADRFGLGRLWIGSFALRSRSLAGLYGRTE
jgi:hypothetical protein